MKKTVSFIAFGLLLLTGCDFSSTDSNVTQNQENFESQTPDVDDQNLPVEVIDADDLIVGKELEEGDEDDTPDEVEVDDQTSEAEQDLEEEVEKRGNWSAFAEKYNESYVAGQENVNFDGKQVNLNGVIEQLIEHENLDGSVSLQVCFGMDEGTFPKCQIKATFSNEARGTLKEMEASESLLDLICGIEGKSNGEILLKDCLAL